MSAACVFEARDVRKAYGATEALRGVSFSLKPGEVHGLIGANGAGKSTLCKIIAGIEAPSAGALMLEGTQVRFESVRDAASQGVGIIHQELSLFPNLSVAENLFVGREIHDGFGLVAHRAQLREARRILETLGFDVDVQRLVGELPIGTQQIVEIARALTQDVKVLLMDEPTSALSRPEIERLFHLVRTLALRGVAIVYISHRLDEMIEICDRVTVMRDGAIVAEGACAQISPAWIAEQMTGRVLERAPGASDAARGDNVLTLRGLELPARDGRATLRAIDLTASAGEVIGIFGQLGAGRSELFETILGVHRDAVGDVLVLGADLKRLHIAERVARGVALLPEDRQADGLIPTMSVRHNMTVAALDRMARFGCLQSKRERAASATMVSELGIKLPSLEAMVRQLSGGNQQKVVLARTLLVSPKLLLLDEPTRGVDVAAKAEILAQMRRLAAKGVAVMFISSDVSEIMVASSRIIVMSRGRIAMETTPDRTTQAALLEAASVDAPANFKAAS